MSYRFLEGGEGMSGLLFYPRARRSSPAWRGLLSPTIGSGPLGQNRALPGRVAAPGTNFEAHRPGPPTAATTPRCLIQAVFKDLPPRIRIRDRLLCSANGNVSKPWPDVDHGDAFSRAKIKRKYQI